MYSVVGADGAEYGPVDIAQLVDWAREGRVVPRTPVVDHASTRRYLACDIPELAAVFSAPPVAGPVVPAPPAYPIQPAYAPLPARVDLDGRPLKSRVAAALLAFLLPGLGIHRFYLGYVGIGILQILSNVLCGMGVIWSWVEGIICLVGGMTDADGRPLAD